MRFLFGKDNLLKLYKVPIKFQANKHVLTSLKKLQEQSLEIYKYLKENDQLRYLKYFSFKMEKSYDMDHYIFFWNFNNLADINIIEELSQAPKFPYIKETKNVYVYTFFNEADY